MKVNHTKILLQFDFLDSSANCLLG
uniref:Uncharacterized protein n=1 Tax=Rhizophora mucronata TaxID=61149 RepID=A0A2P2PFV9_RHIMU